MNRKQFNESMNDTVVSVMDEFIDEIGADVCDIQEEVKSVMDQGVIHPEDLGGVLSALKDLAIKVY